MYLLEFYCLFQIRKLFILYNFVNEKVKKYDFK